MASVTFYTVGINCHPSIRKGTRVFGGLDRAVNNAVLAVPRCPLANTEIETWNRASVPYHASKHGVPGDPAKDAENQRKHGVAFVDAQFAFLDPTRVIAKDLSHSKGEPRFYCFGETGGGVLTVRFTYRGQVIRIIGAGYWRRGKKIYEAHSKVPR